MEQRTNMEVAVDERALNLYLHIGSYEAVINKYSNPFNPHHWDKYKRLKRKVMAWQSRVH